MEIDTSSFLDVRESVEIDQLKAQPVITKWMNGADVAVVPIHATGQGRCQKCVGYNSRRAVDRVRCMTLPDCTDVAFVEATEENIPLYIAWRLSNGTQ